MRTRDILLAILEEQRRTNDILDSMKKSTAQQAEDVRGKTGQADLLMQQAMQILNQHIGGKQ